MSIQALQQTRPAIALLGVRSGPARAGLLSGVVQRGQFGILKRLFALPNNQRLFRISAGLAIALLRLSVQCTDARKLKLPARGGPTSMRKPLSRPKSKTSTGLPRHPFGIIRERGAP